MGWGVDAHAHYSHSYPSNQGSCNSSRSGAREVNGGDQRDKVHAGGGNENQVLRQQGQNA